jgi:hypothetical protein
MNKVASIIKLSSGSGKKQKPGIFADPELNTGFGTLAQLV